MTTRGKDTNSNQTKIKTFTNKLLDTKSKFLAISIPLLSFTVGALVGSVMMVHTTFFSIIIPLVIIIGIAIDLFLRYRREMFEMNRQREEKTAEAYQIDNIEIVSLVP